MRTHRIIGVVMSLMVLLINNNGTHAQTAATKPTTNPGQVPPYTLTPIQIRELKGSTIIYKSMQTTLNSIAKALEQPMLDLEKALTESKIGMTNGPVLIYKGVTPDPNAQFTLEIAIPVADDAKAPQGYQTRRLEGARSAVVLYTGPTTDMGPAYQELLPQIFQLGLTPTQEVRERYLYWESDESKNNVVMIEIPLAQ